MSTVTSIGCTRMGEFVADREQDTADEAQYQREQRYLLVKQRAEEINTKRCAELSLEDMALAFELLSTYKSCLAQIREDLLKGDVLMVHSMTGMISGALMGESFAQAHAEFRTLDAVKSGDRH